FLVTLGLLGLGLIFTLEFFYMRDIYPTHFRANTMFKIGFQIWLWFSLIGGVVVARLVELPFFRRVICSNLSLLLILCGGFYTWLAPQQAFFGFNVVHSMDGRDFLRRTAPEDVSLIDWINKNIDGQPVIVE